MNSFESKQPLKIEGSEKGYSVIAECPFCHQTLKIPLDEIVLCGCGIHWSGELKLIGFDRR